MIEAQQEGVDLGQGCEVFRMMIQGVFLVAVGDEENVVIGDGQVEAESIGPVLETLLESSLFFRRWAWSSGISPLKAQSRWDFSSADLAA
jgi:hypothetical protein